MRGSQFLMSVLLIVLVSNSCRERQPILFELPIRLNFEVPAGLNPFERHFFTIRDVPTNLSNLRRQHNIDDNRALVIKPGSAVFSSIFQEVDFTFIEEIGISVYTGDDPDDDTDVFLTDFVPTNAGKNVNILPFDHDVADVLDVAEINFKVALRFRSPPPSFIEANIEVKFTAE